MSFVHIFGLNHFHQNLEDKCVTAAGKEDERAQKAGLRTVLSEIIANNRVDLIAEEGCPGGRYLGEDLAELNRVAYVDITMPLAERKTRGIRTPGYDRDDETRARAYREFERYMYERTRERGANVVLVMCGRYHSGGLDRLFRDAGDETRVYDITSYEWYQGVPLEGPEGVADHDTSDD
jgi:hypothetical protein